MSAKNSKYYKKHFAFSINNQKALNGSLDAIESDLEGEEVQAKSNSSKRKNSKSETRIDEQRFKEKRASQL